MENSKYNENEIKLVFEYIKTDNVDALKKAVSENQEIKRLKLGNLPLASVALLFGASECVDFLLSVYGETNAYVEADSPLELCEEWQDLLHDFVSKSENTKSNESSDENSTDTSSVFELYDGARFIEPSEIAVLQNDVEKANHIISKVSVKTISARNRLETLLKMISTYELCGKEGSYCIKGFKKSKGKKGFVLKRKRFWIWLAVAVLVSVLVPTIVLASIRVKVTYYVDNAIYGYEQGVVGGDITVAEPQKEGYTFIGWYTDNETQTPQNKLPKKNSDLYARWAVNSYTIKLDFGEYTFEEEYESEIKGDYGTTFELPILKLEGKLFLGWFDEDSNLLTSNVYKKDLVIKPKFVDFEDNSIDNPYEISNQNEFLYLCEQEGYFTVKDGLIIDQNFVSSGYVCNHSKGFSGYLDGQGKTLYFNGVMPLFLNVSENGTVKNLNIIVDENIKLINYKADRFGVVSAVNSGLVDNVTVTFSKKDELGTKKSVEISSLWFLSYVGCLSGSNSGTIKECLVDGAFEINIPSPYRSFCYTGGIVGANIGQIENSRFTAKAHIEIYNGGFGGLVGYNSGTISECRNIGGIEIDGKTVTTTDYIDGYVTQVGGIVAVNGSSTSDSGKVDSGKVISSVNYADITVSNQNTELYVGGIASYSESSINSAENFGKINIEKTEYVQYLGGIVGFSATRGQGEVKNCTNNASIETISKGYAYLGGIVGFSISSNADDKLNVENCINKGDLTSGTQIGGIVGYAVYSSINKCENSGKIATVISSNADSQKAMGGIIGGAMDCLIIESFNHGNIILNANGYNVANYLGGLVADNVDTSIYNSANTATLSYGENEVAGLVCGVVNSKNGNVVFENVYALSDGKTVAFYAYDSSLDENGDYIDHADGDKSIPKLYPENKGLVDSINEISEELGIRS